MKVIFLTLFEVLLRKIALLILLAVSISQLWGALHILQTDLDITRILGAGVLLFVGTLSGFVTAVAAVLYWRSLKALYWLLRSWPEED